MLGRRTSYTDARGRRTDFRWDNRSEVVWKRHADSSELRITYDANAKVTMLEESGRVWQYEYGGLHWLTKITGPLGDETDFRYDVEGNLTFVRNARGQVFRQLFDVANRPIGCVTFEGIEQHGILDVAGKVISSKTPDGTTVSTYDEFGMLTTVEFADGETVALEHLRGSGVMAVDNGKVVTESWYDGVGQVVRDRQGPHRSTIGWTGGEVSSVVSDIGLPVQLRGRSESAHRTNLEITVGTTKAILNQPVNDDFLDHLGEGLVIRKSYGPTGLLTRQVLCRRDRNLDDSLVGSAEDPNVIFWVTYEYDAWQLLRRETRSDGDTIEYDVDASDHIVERRVIRNGQVVERELVDYDRAGTPRVRGAIFDQLARPIGLDDEIFEYDQEGRLAVRRTKTGDVKYLWSSSGCLLEVDAPDRVVKMDYDGRGRRMKKRVFRNNELVSSTSYVWTRQVVLHESDDLTGSTRTYLRLNGEWEPRGHVDLRSGTEVACWYINDSIGALDLAVDAKGNVVYSAHRSIFGAHDATVRTVEVSTRFVNQHYDADVGLVYNRFRWYEPRLGLYVSRDPLELDGTLNPRDYARNPRRYIDPLGLVMSISNNPQPAGGGHPTRPARPTPAVVASGDQTHTYLTGPGHWATNGTAATPGYVVADGPERRGRSWRSTTTTAIDAAGDEYGCHSCGRTRTQVTAQDGKFGHWRKDHQPPLSHVAAADAHRQAAGQPVGTVRIYPHCPRCSSTQGGGLASRPPTAAEAARAATIMNPRAGDASRRGPSPRP